MVSGGNAVAGKRSRGKLATGLGAQREQYHEVFRGQEDLREELVETICGSNASGLRVAECIY